MQASSENSRREAGGAWMGTDPELISELAAAQDERGLKPEESDGEHGISRRDFLAQLGAAGVVVTSAPLAAAVEPAAGASAAAAGHGLHAPPVAVRMNVNGQEHALQLDARTTLLDCLR